MMLDTTAMFSKLFTFLSARQKQVNRLADSSHEGMACVVRPAILTMSGHSATASTGRSACATAPAAPSRALKTTNRAERCITVLRITHKWGPSRNVCCHANMPRARRPAELIYVGIRKLVRSSDLGNRMTRYQSKSVCAPHFTLGSDNDLIQTPVCKAGALERPYRHLWLGNRYRFGKLHPDLHIAIIFQLL